MENISRILKICFAVWLHAIIFICCKSIALAAPSADDLYQFYADTYSSSTGMTIPLSNWQSFVNTAPNYSSYEKFYMGVGYGNGFTQTYLFGCASNQVVSVSGSSFIVNTGMARCYVFNSSGTYVYYQDVGSISGLTSNIVNEVVVINVDWDNPYYNPLLVIPEIEVKYTMDIEMDSTPVIPLSVALKNANSNYFVEVVCVNYMPSIVSVKWQEYSALFSHKFAQHDLISHDVLKVSSEVSSNDIGEALNIAWLQDVTNYPVSEVGFINDIGTDTNSVRAYNNMVDNYEIARKVGCFYGNNTEIYVRYFTIEDETKFVVSAWRTWTSQYSENFGIQLPSYYKTFSEASGYEDTNQNTGVVIAPTSVPDSVNPSNQTGTKKGSPITINIGQNVPNYPDYPTIASYNLDNLLVSTIDNVKGLGNFFSGFAGFCTVTFAWIPKEIWQIIAIGFALSIVVMFLKIL